MSNCKKGRGNKLVQKVVIPKGMINPGETTIIEIPSTLQKQPIVVAKRKTSVDSVTFNNAYCAKKNKDVKIKEHHGGRDHQKVNYTPETLRTRRKDSTSNQHNTADLDSTERKEREQFLKDLEEFQKARRKLLANASFLAGENNNTTICQSPKK